MTTAVAFRVDASPQIGIGHFMRCLTLADALHQRGAQSRFVSRHLPEYLREMLLTRGHEYVAITSVPSERAATDLAHGHWLGTAQADDAGDTARALSDRRWHWIVVDHYALDIRWEGSVRTSVGRILVIDDLADRVHDCDVLLDQNYYADMERRYVGKVPAHCEVLTGPKYALLRDEFRQQRERLTPRSGLVRRVLVCFGGVDADNHTRRAIEALAALDADTLAVDVVIGASHVDRAGIESACRARGFACHVQLSGLAELMAAADLSIGAGGSTTWERCSVGLPSLVFGLADNQRELIRDSAAAGIIYAPDPPRDGPSSSFVERHLRALIENAGLRQAISRRAMETVDGRGVWRLVRRMNADHVAIREAASNDSRRLFEWRNHPAIRAVSHHTGVIDWEVHQAWYASVLANSNRKVLIGSACERDLGVVRFDIDGQDAEVSIYLVPGEHAPGAGSGLLAAAERWLIDARPAVRQLRASVRAGNLPSDRLFEGAGYRAESTWYSKPLVSR